MLSRRDLFWGYAAQILNIGLGLIMVPVIVRYMSPMEVGLWFVFITLISLAQLLELGFQPTLARNVAYIYAGAQKLSAFGLQENGNGNLNISLLADLVAASRWIYRWIAFLAALVLLVGGTIYIETLIPKEQGYSVVFTGFKKLINCFISSNQKEQDFFAVFAEFKNCFISSNQKEQDFFTVFAGWFAFVIGNIINFYYGYLNALLQGRGDVIAANKVLIASKSIQVLVGVGIVMWGFGLLGLGIASLLSTIVSRTLAMSFVFSRQHPEMTMLVPTTEGMKSNIKILWYNSSRYGIVLVGVFLILRANMLVASSYLGLVDAASYGLTIHIFILLTTIATVPYNLSLPKLNALRAQGKQEQAYKSFSMLLITVILVYSIEALIVLFCGNNLLNIIGSSTKLPNNFVLLGMVLVFLLEINHGTCANFITTGNQIPFVRAAVISGCCIVTGSILLAPIFGIAGLVISQGIAQMAYNNWKWPTEVGKIFHTSFLKITADGLSFLLSRLLIRGK